MVNAEPCSMGGLIDYDVSVGTKSSPRSLAIEKAQEELRQEYDVREERRRELEFLEKGGNPLDFKFVHVETGSVHSTSLTNQIAEQNVISDAKGSFAASPHGYSLESSGKPGSSLCRETNTADNLMLLGGVNNDLAEEKIVKRGTKRTNAAQPKQSLSTGGHNNSKNPEESGLSRLGVKSQAYVRRNRSKPSRESANVSPTRSSVISAIGSEPKVTKDVVKEKQTDDHGVLSISSSKQAGSDCENVPNKTASDDQVTMELDRIQTIRESDCAVKSESKQVEHNDKATAVTSNDADSNRLLVASGELAAEVGAVGNPDANSEAAMRAYYSSASTGVERKSCPSDEKAGNNHLDENIVHINAGELDNKRLSSVSDVETSTLHKNTVHADEDGNMDLDAAKNDEKSCEDLDSERHSYKGVNGSGQSEGFVRPTSMSENSDHVQPKASDVVHVKDEMDVSESAIVAQKDMGCRSSYHIMNNEGSPASGRLNTCLGDPNSADPIAVGSDLHKNHLHDAMPSLKNDESNVESEIIKSGGNLDKMAKKEHEDSILREARAIEASNKRAGERSRCNIVLDKRKKGHWDFVLEEMAWMANDFMQERLWKSVAAAQVCHWISSDGRAKFEEASIQRKQKTIMKSLTNGIMGFWRSAEALRAAGRTAKLMQGDNSTILQETKLSGIKVEKEQGNESLEAEESRQPRQSEIQDYAVRFLEYNSRTADSLVLAEAPPTPDRLNDFGIVKVSDQLSEENLFYTVAPGAMLAYRESVESLFMYHKKAGNTEFKDDYEVSVCDSAADYEEDEGETCTYVSPEAYDGLLSKINHKKKHLMQQSSGARPYKIGTDLPYEPCLESKSGNQPFLSNGKRPTSFLAIPTKRIRTAARQRVVSPFYAGASGPAQVTSKTDVSSGETSSYQDDESSLHGGSLPWRNMDFESTVDFDRHLPYDGSEVYTKPNKKKKLKKPGYKAAQNAANSCASAAMKGRMYDQRQQVDLITKYEQKDYLKKRSEAYHYDSNGNSVANGGQHALKKLKLMKQGVDISQESSPVASQMSNMANPAKFIKIIANRDRGRKCKALKMTFSGGWSNFEDQALVVLVHDMGQNWELISDAINSIVQFKSVHRQPKECKERHKVLVERSSGDGADSAEDSGSSRHYNSSLPGIPKGSARQLFERLHGPFEEENLKAHFEKMIVLMQQMHSRRRQGKSQELKRIIQPHASHANALSQALPSNLSGVTLTPLDLCDAMSPNLDAITPGSMYPGSHSSALTLPNHQGSVGPTTPTSNMNSRLPGSPGIVLGSNLSSPSTLSTSRDAQKYGVPRPTSLQSDEQLKIQYNQMVSGRNHQQSVGSVPGALPAGADRGARMLPGIHGMGMVAGLNRGMPAPRAGFPRMGSPGMLNVVSSGNQFPNGGQGVQSAVSVHPGAISGPGNSMSRPRDPMQMLRPGQNMEEHRQIVMPEFQMQASHGISQSVHFSSMNQSFSNAAASSPVQQPQQLHHISQSSHMFGNPQHSQIQGASSSPQQQQAHAVRLAKERQMQQLVLPQQHSDLSGGSAVPIVQSGPQIQEQNPASAANPVPCSQPQHHRQQAAQNPPDSSSSPNQPALATQLKQKKQQGQPQCRQNQQQRNQGSQQAKLMKSLGRGNMLMPQTPSVDSTPANSVSTPSKKHVSDKKLMQHGQGFLPANTAPNQSMLQPGNEPKQFTSPLPQSPKRLPDVGSQGLMQVSSSQNLLAPQQPPLPSKSILTTLQQQRQINPSQNSIQRTVMQQNHQMSSECRTDSHFDQVQHNQMVPASIPQSTDTKLLSSPKNSSFGNETLLPPSSQDVLQRQISGGFPIGQGGGGQWNQQARQQLQSPHQQRPVVEGSVFPSNSGPG
ncbi:hypothetical protein ACP70R_033797 [Stipagrostis hirtigluma subsp. patula]